jgi:hypothetical protein
MAAGEPPVVEVVVAFPLGKEALSALQTRAGAGVSVRDLRQSGPAPDLVLCPPSSPQLIANVRQQFPSARVIVVELEDWLESRRAQGPVGRALDAGASGYYVAPDSEALAVFLTEVAAGASLSIGQRAGGDRAQGLLTPGPGTQDVDGDDDAL